MRPRLIILSLVLLATAGSSFLLWKSSPGQIIKAQAHRLFKCLEKTVLGSDTTSEKADLLGALITPSFEVQAPYPVNSGSLTRSPAGHSLREFHDSIMSCKIHKENARIHFDTDRAGRYQTELSVEISVGPRRQHHLRYQCLIEFIQSEGEWLAREISLNPM